jgi:metal-responsive CopG/Arc/MetJ family transcriptional regulator
MNQNTVRTTLTLPSELIAATDDIVKAEKAKSRNQFIAQALQRELAHQRKMEIDSALAEMTQDPDYQVEVLQMEAEFSSASWEALQVEEDK